MPYNPSTTKSISNAGYAISAIFFLLYGPGLWLSYQACVANGTCSNDVAGGYMGVGMAWALLSFIGILMLSVSLILDLISIFRAKSSPYFSTRYAVWYNGSSIIGILVCAASFLFRITTDTIDGWGIQAIILLSLVITPPIMASRHK